ncbi:cytochrome c biogenesis protein CcsA [Pusillimonas sp. CC-YST705]|uniref:Cytochrome c biogenesis protein CcsA n=1 Tax=Mesopusillimonas faecipullorum TaxID=2755040 RepID=A0ABS8CFV4_9BURK|nr:cytochrome c biogenesis protein CcsA [Mesopusillimonas faecipullorum]MCB5364923.1 cytochrome c biogenesis protein CcsA [Mesopusillimonas faecipullorum]
MPAGIVLHSLAALAYSLMAAVFIRPLSRQTSNRLGWAGRIGLLLALALHGMGLAESIMQGPNLYLGWALALSVAVWLGMIVFWLESLALRIDSLLILLLPAAALICALAAIFPNAHLVTNTGSGWLRLHLLIALMAYGLTTVSALQALLMAALDNYLHRPVEQAEKRGWISRALDAMPPLLTQEHLLFRLIGISFFALTLTVVSGAIVSLQLVGKIFPLDHKTVFTLLSWLTFAWLLLGRYAWGWRGRRALRWTLLGFALLILAYSGSHFVLDVILNRG